MKRAKESCKIALGLPSLGMIKQDKRLREMNYGIYEGKKFTDLPKVSQ
jgi:broad specificity phosphatase PhoE